MDHKSQLIYINSANRSFGTIGDFELIFTEGLMQCSHEQSLELTVMDCCINRSWLTVNNANNTYGIRVSGIPASVVYYTIPEGYYDCYSFLTLLKQQQPTWTITYNDKNNKYSFSPSISDVNVYEFVFTNKSCHLFGFNVGESIQFSHATPLTSSIPIRMNRENTLMIHCDIAKDKYSLDNLSGPAWFDSDVLLSIPMTCAPFNNVTYQITGADTFTYTLSSSQLSKMRIFLTDENNVPLEPVYDWTLTLKLTYINNDDDHLLATVKNIKDYVQYIVLDKHMIPQQQ